MNSNVLGIEGGGRQVAEGFTMARAGAVAVERIECDNCPLGHAAGVGQGCFCPFITRQYGRDEPLCRAGDPADMIWFVKRGVVGLTMQPGDDVEIDALRLPGSYVGLECLVGDMYTYNARTLTRATLCGAPREGFLRWLRADDQRMAKILRAVLGDLVAASEPGLAWPPSP